MMQPYHSCICDNPLPDSQSPSQFFKDRTKKWSNSKYFSYFSTKTGVVCTQEEQLLVGYGEDGTTEIDFALQASS